MNPMMPLSQPARWQPIKTDQRQMDLVGSEWYLMSDTAVWVEELIHGSHFLCCALVAKQL
jgi:hypothetical protein